MLAILLGGASVAFSAPSIPPSALPATLKPEPHQRDPYDWNARHEAVKKRNRTVKPEYVMIGDSITHHWGGEPSGDGKNTGAGSWEKLFRPHTATNMGFGYNADSFGGRDLGTVRNHKRGQYRE